MVAAVLVQGLAIGGHAFLGKIYANTRVKSI
jgi:hypothetical protein